MLRDISITVSAAVPEWPGDTPFSCGWTWRIADGASVNVSALTTSPHVGTHADAPLHVRDGWTAAHELALDAFVGPARVLDVRRTTGQCDLAALERAGLGDGVERLLLRTGRSIADGEFPVEWPALTRECAQALVASGLRLLGVDCPSVDERTSTALTVHHVLFTGGACVLENLDLRDVEPGDYELIAPPIKLEGLDAAPVRALLRELR